MGLLRYFDRRELKKIAVDPRITWTFFISGESVPAELTFTDEKIKLKIGEREEEHLWTKIHPKKFVYEETYIIKINEIKWLQGEDIARNKAVAEGKAGARGAPKEDGKFLSHKYKRKGERE